MTKQFVYDYILVNTNQYFVGKENFEITPEVLDGLIQKALMIYGNYFPVYVVAPVKITSKKMPLSTIIDNLGIERSIINITNIYFMDPTTLPFDARDALKIPFFWKYDDVRNVLLNSFEKGIYYIEALTTPVLDDMNNNASDFLELIVGLALIYIGHNRTDFALSELPFDIRDLRDEGQQIVDKVIEGFENSAGTPWYEAIELL